MARAGMSEMIVGKDGLIKTSLGDCVITETLPRVMLSDIRGKIRRNFGGQPWG
jgi:hypothetical protein